MQIGVDPAKPGSERTIITGSGVSLGLAPGDRVHLGVPDPNRVRRLVGYVLGSSFELLTVIRPSRGFARHVRRRKAAAR